MKTIQDYRNEKRLNSHIIEAFRLYLNSNYDIGNNAQDLEYFLEQIEIYKNKNVYLEKVIEEMLTVQNMNLPYKVGDKVRFKGTKGRDNYIRLYERNGARQWTCRHIRRAMDECMNETSEITWIGLESFQLTGDLVSHSMDHEWFYECFEVI